MVLTLSLSRSAWLRAVMEIGTTCWSSSRLRAVTTIFSRPPACVLGAVPAVSAVASACARAGATADPVTRALLARRARARARNMIFPFGTGACLNVLRCIRGEALKEMGNQIKAGKGGRLLLVKPCGIYALRATEARFQGAGR